MLGTRLTSSGDCNLNGVTSEEGEIPVTDVISDEAAAERVVAPAPADTLDEH